MLHNLSLSGLWDIGIGAAHARRPLAPDTTLMEQAEPVAEEPAAGKAALQQAGDRRRDCLTHHHASDVGHHAAD